MHEVINDEIFIEQNKNIEYLKSVLIDNSDVVYRNFYIGKNSCAIVYIDGMSDKLLLDAYVLKPVMLRGENLDVNKIKDELLTVSDVKSTKSMKDSIKAILSGDTVMFLDGLLEAFVIGTRLWPARSVSEPSGETVLRGGRDGFTETIRFNTALVRRRIRDTRLRVVSKSIGTRSKTDVAFMYIEDIVNKDVLEEVNKRVEKINIDAILDSGYVEQFIEDNKNSPFPQTQNTERPDVTAAALYEGRIAILVDNSPFAVIVPATLPNLFQSPDDYYQRWLFSSAVRILRFFSIFLSLILPSLYVAATSFNPSIIPTRLAYFIAASREGVPFPAFIEALIMEISLAFLMESVVRLPKPISATIGIVGGLIIGQAAVSAGVVSPIMIIIVSVTAITSFTAPNYEVNSAFRIVRLILIILSSILGLYGIMIGLIVLLIHLSRLKSFGIPYLSPIVNPNGHDYKDLFIRAPLSSLKKRPEYMKTVDKVRQR
ncbi:MAG: spore germination protein [Solirubrobacterales bacterium]